MTKAVLTDVKATDVQVGDTVLGFYGPTGAWCDRSGSALDSDRWTVIRVTGKGDVEGKGRDGSSKYLRAGAASKFKVERDVQVLTTSPVVHATANFGPTKKAIPDWPLACPRCQRTASAVLLFMGYDCKHGCFK